MSSLIKVDIVLATYNGDKYIEEQIISIFEQCHSNWRLIVSDDNSTDNTVPIIKKLVEDYGYKDRVLYVEKYRNDLLPGPVTNFFNGLYYADSEYIMFCDQDDVWNKNKIHSQLNAILTLDNTKPSLSFCDSTVVDSNLNTLQSSFRKYEKLSIKNNTLSVQKLMFQNYAPGCCMIINRKLKDLIFSRNIEFENIVMHDWFLMILASICGNIKVSNEKLMLYRQHSNNQVGVSDSINLKNIGRKLIKSKINHDKSKNQLKYINGLDLVNSHVLDNTVKIFNKNKFARLYFIYTNHIKKSDISRTIWLYLLF